MGSYLNHVRVKKPFDSHPTGKVVALSKLGFDRMREKMPQHIELVASEDEKGRITDPDGKPLKEVPENKATTPHHQG